MFKMVTVDNSCEIAFEWKLPDPLDGKSVSIFSGKGLVPDRTKPLPELMLIKIYDSTGRP